MERSIQNDYNGGVARPREFDEDEVVSAVLRCFWSRGYASTSVQELSAATGLGNGSLYGAFGGKRDLYLRAFQSYCAATLESLESALKGPDADALSRLAAHIHKVASGSADNARGCFLANATSELAAHDPAVAAQARETIDAYERLLATNIRQAQSSADIDPRHDPRSLAAVLLSVLRGMDALGKSGKSGEFMKTAADATVAILTAQ